MVCCASWDRRSRDTHDVGMGMFVHRSDVGPSLRHNFTFGLGKKNLGAVQIWSVLDFISFSDLDSMAIDYPALS